MTIELVQSAENINFREKAGKGFSKKFLAAAFNFHEKQSRKISESGYRPSNAFHK